MIGHEAPAEDADIMAEQSFSKYLKVADSILIGVEDCLPIVAALGNVMRYAGKYESRSARHAVLVRKGRTDSQQIRKVV